MRKRKLFDQTLVVVSHAGLNLLLRIELGQPDTDDDLGPTIFIGILLQHHSEANQCGKRRPNEIAYLPEFPLRAVPRQEITDG